MKVCLVYICTATQYILSSIAILFVDGFPASVLAMTVSLTIMLSLYSSYLAVTVMLYSVSATKWVSVVVWGGETSLTTVSLAIPLL